jgi:hypothetical protein
MQQVLGNANKYIMLIYDLDDCGVPVYMVCNDQGVCLIRTKDFAIASFVENHSHGIDPSLRLTVGGDRGTAQYNNPIFYHVRRFTK